LSMGIFKVSKISVLGLDQCMGCFPSEQQLSNQLIDLISS